jgi:hypothetical protein
MTKKTKLYLESLPVLDHAIKCKSVMIIPNGKLHDSKFETMTYVIYDVLSKKTYKTNGSSDTLNFENTCGWRIECIPQYHAISVWRQDDFEFIPWYSTSTVRECT